MGLYADHIFPWFIDHTEPRELGELRRLTVAQVRGDVLEIGLGTGATLPYYPPATSRLTVVEPAEGMRRHAQRRAGQYGIRLDWHIGRGERLPLDSERFDSVVLAEVLCSVDDVDAVLDEAYRVLRPGGRLHFLEHGLAEDERIRKWQRRLNGLQMITACGCRLTREPERHLRGSRFQVDELVHVAPFAGAGALYTHIRGTATRAV
jgi:ubiquinone/menaquinone biosynthesis C-methylase UbiE